MLPDEPTRILIVRTGALGDLILTLPAIDRIRTENPEAHITIAGNVAFLPLLQNSHSDAILSFESPMLRPFFLQQGVERPVGSTIARLPFDRAFVWLRDVADPFVENLERAGIRVKVAESFQAEERIPQADFLFRIHACAADQIHPGIKAALAPKLQLHKPDAHRAPGLLPRPGRNRIAIHPGAGSMRKRWPIERFQKLARELQNDNDVYWIIGPAEYQEGSSAEMNPVGHVIDSDIVRLAYFLETMDLFIGNDSGVTHLARALDVETIALFGPTNPAVWAPVGAKILQRPGSDGRPDVEIKDVLDLVSGLLSMKAHDTHC